MKSTTEDAVELLQMRGDDDLSWSGDREGGEKWMDLGYVLIAENRNCARFG